MGGPRKVGLASHCFLWPEKKMMMVVTMMIYDGDNDDGDSDVLGKVGLPPHCFRRADKRSVI